MSVLNTDNPDFIVWEHEKLCFDILGGIRMEGLDRLRVTLRVRFDQEVIRHNLDLYNDDALTKLVRKCAERFEMSSSYMYPVVGQLVNLLEDYRIKAIQEAKETTVVKKELTPEEAKAAKQLLCSKNLLSDINDLIGKGGVIGEVDNRLLMYIIFTSRLMANPLHIISMGASGTGKSHLQESVAALLPPEDCMSITDLSPSSFYYFKPNELSHKLLLIEDLDGAKRVLYPLRELQSKKYITKTFVEKTRQGLRTTSRTVYGPVCVAGCTTQEQIYEDNSNRSFLIYIDDSEDQDQLIMDYQRTISAGTRGEVAQEQAKVLLQNSQRILEPLKVVNPFASQLVLPKSVFKPRRTNAHYLHFIEAVTFLHQAQRTLHVSKETGEQWIETTIEDIQNANVLMKDILLKKSDKLSPAVRSYFEQLKSYLKRKKRNTFTHTDISYGLEMSLTRVKRYHYALMDNNYLKMKKVKGKKANQYQVVSYQEYKELQSHLDNELNKALDNIKKNNRPKRTRKTTPKMDG
ncbi:MAG: hypothetical protein GQ574_29165 [Crocinitomix sp.]|nr:hypothetical protein [Crocinitomix sp.]